MHNFCESTVELATLDWLQILGYTTRFGGDIAPGEPAAERADYREVVLLEPLRSALAKINKHIPASVRAGALDEAIRKATRTESQNPIANNHAFHRLLTEGVDVSYRLGGQIKHDKVWLVDFEQPAANDWLAVNQFTITDVNLTSRAKTNRRPDVILFVNGLPLVVIELKNAADEHATVRNAFNQLQTYKDDIPSLFTYNALLVISDGLDARLGTLTAGWEWFKPWRTVDGETVDPPGQTQLETLIKGVFEPARFLDLIRNFLAFEVDGATITKKIAAYHQFHAVNRAVAKTLDATRVEGDRRVGVVWHTQGSGKSLSMLFYAGKIIAHPAMQNPTIVMLTDRNDLDDQLFGTFAAGQELLRQTPVQAEDRAHLRELLAVASGGVVFTTIQKFLPEGQRDQFPLLSERRNVVFIADEAHRSQYGLEARVVKSGEEAYIGYGFAKYVRDALPNASFIGFTGTPIETTDADTRKVFGDYIDIYDIQRAITDGATVPIYYEGRLAKLRLKDDQRPKIDPTFEEITEGEETEVKDKLMSKWSQLEAMVGASERLDQIAADIVTHFEGRLATLDGKGMIVCMSRRICVELYDAIIRLRPEWHSGTDDAGALKVVMTGSADDPAEYQPHSRNKPRRKALAERFKDPADSLKLVIVRDMWLTGFDAPPLHTMYVDKPMRGHGLMQAIARVNRVYKDKPGGLIVDYLGIAPDLQAAVATYTASGSGSPTKPFDEAISVMLDQFSITKAMFHGFNYDRFFNGTPAQRLAVIPAGMEHILTLLNGKKRYLDAVTRLSKAFALAMPDGAALDIRDEVAFFQAVRSAFVKLTVVEGRSQEDLDNAVKQLVSEAVAAPEVISIFEAAGLQAPNISILSDQFLHKVQELPQKNLALELLRKLLSDEIKARSRQNVVKARSFAALLEDAIRRYQNQAVDTAEVISELIEIAREVRKASEQGEQLGLSPEELAFYDALAANQSAVDVLGDRNLAIIAHELVKTVRDSVSIDWTVKQSARAKIRVLVKRILKKYGYPPDLQEAATTTVLEQAELFASEWAG
ncbi:MAG: type I restriction endonuclease subunit R [Anaerolinea sp.]|nr:type I restriction endonuclease subunit R [Anaerolinea sp.]